MSVAPDVSQPGSAPDPTNDSASASTARRRFLGPTDLALIAAFAALTSVLAYLGAIPVGGAGVPITLQTLGIMLGGCILGPVRGFLAAALYLALGAVGLPVFAEHSSGVGVLTGFTAGYLWSFPVAALVAGLLVKYVAGPHRTRAVVVFCCSIAASILVIHPMGIIGLKWSLDLTLGQAIDADKPFWLGDIVKTSFVAFIAAEVHRAFPRLLQR